MKRVLVISPHPDDETIGCGGTICKHVQEGHQVCVVFLTSGEKGGHGRSPSETKRMREREARDAARILGIHRVEFWREPDGAVKPTVQLLTRMRSKIKQWRPDVIYVPHEQEMHRDHQEAFRLLKRSLAGPTFKKIDVLLFEVWTPIQTLDEIVDISEFMPAKLRAVRKYKSQCAVLDFPEAVRGLNRYRGEMHSWPGGDYAEVFSRLRA